jgi:Co/Zn/Cd efflux system component
MHHVIGHVAHFAVRCFAIYLFVIPLALVNANIANRKGRSKTFYGWMSIIPFVGMFMSLFLISLTDKAVVDKIDRLLEALEKKA